MPRLTGRDLSALAYLEEMRAMWEPDVAVLLGRLSGRGPVSPTSVRTALRRWSKLGMVQVSKLYAHQPRLVWLTSQGYAMTGGTGTWREPGPGVLRHTAEVARMRSWIEDRGIAGQKVVEWVSERRWRQEHAEAVRQGAHVPDAVAVVEDGTVWALEVELSSKTPGRTLDIAIMLTNAFPHVAYLVPEGSQAARTVRGSVAELAQQRGVSGGQGVMKVVEMPAAPWEQGVSWVDRKRGLVAEPLTSSNEIRGTR